jgi:hypothetical protein
MERFSLLVVLAALVAAAATSSWHRPVDAAIVGGLKVGFYDRTCPLAERTVREIVNTDMNNDPSIPAGLIRIFFHDCFVTVRVVRARRRPKRAAALLAKYHALA